MTEQLRTPEYLADKLGVPRDHVLRLVRRHQWPHRRLSRQYIRFTDADIAEILRRSRVMESAPAGKGVGLTSRSAARQRTRARAGP